MDERELHLRYENRHEILKNNINNVITYLCSYYSSGFEKIDFRLKTYRMSNVGRDNMIYIEYEGINFGAESYDFNDEPPKWHEHMRIPIMKDDRFTNKNSFFLKSNICLDYFFVIYGPAILNFEEVYVSNKKEAWNKGWFRVVSDNVLHFEKIGLCWCTLIDALHFIEWKTKINFLNENARKEVKKYIEDQTFPEEIKGDLI